MVNKRVLAFAPYGSWTIHHQFDAVVGTALRLRGGEMRVLLCDGLFRNCLLAGKSNDALVCKSCQSSGQQLFSNFPVESRQIFAHLKPSDFSLAREWSESLPVSGHSDAVFDGVFVGKFVHGTLCAYCMSSQLDYSQPSVLTASRGYLYNGALLIRAVRSHLQDYRPGHALCFNGVHAYYRIFFELCRAEGIPVLVHEAGLTRDDFTLFPSFHNFDFHGRNKEWESLSGTPLEIEKCLRLKAYFDDRAKTIKSGEVPIYGFETDPLKVRQSLRVPEGKPIICAFTSSDWEVGIGQGKIDFTYTSQLEWLRDTARICAAEGYFLVIRHHPNNDRKDTFCRQFLRDLLLLNAEFGEQVRVVMPSEKITSYGLLWSIDLCVSFITTMGAEASIRGIPSICVADSLYRNMGMEYIRDKNEYRDAIHRGLSRSRTKAIEDLRRAYRAGNYLYFSNYKFQSFGFKNGGMDFRIKTTDELLPGVDPTLDQVCEHILIGTPLRKFPGVNQTGTAKREEDGFLAAELDALNEMRSTVRSGSAWDTEAMPVVSIVRLKSSPETADKWNWEGQMLRSRHKNLHIQNLRLPSEASMREKMDMLSTSLKSVSGEFVYIASDNILVDECVLSTSVDLLSDLKNASISAVTWDGWLCGPDGNIVDSLFGREEKREWEQIAKSSPLMSDPFILMGFMVIRTAHLKILVQDWALSEWGDGGALAFAVFQNCLVSGLSSYAMQAPMLWLFPVQDNTLTPLADLAFIYRMMGDLERAGQSYLVALDENPGDDMLGDEYLKIMEELGKAEDGRRQLALRGNKVALNLASTVQESLPVENGLRIKPPNINGTKGMPSVSPASPDYSKGRAYAPESYEEIATKVDTVKGWLVNGQEKYLFDKVKSLPDGACILEMGANFGRSTCAMAFACLGTTKHIYSIDTFSGNEGVMGRDQDFYLTWRENLERFGLQSHATALRGYTFDVLKDRSRFPAPLFVFIDASHEYFDVLQDFRDIYDYIPVGGWVAFHDVEINWPGPWRVWHEFASYLLTDHQRVSTLACGRKSHVKPFGRTPGATLGFSYARKFLEEIELVYSASSPLCKAFRTSLEGITTTQKDCDVLVQAEVCIAETPERGYRVNLMNMLSVKDANMDGHIRLWYGLTLIAEGKVDEAWKHLIEAPLCSYPVPRRRVDPYLKMIKNQAMGDFRDADTLDLQFKGFQKKGVDGETVIAFRSGDGKILRGLEGKRKVGIEYDRELRKNAINNFGIDSVESISEIEDGVADVLVCGAGFDNEPAPLLCLKLLFPKLRKGGRAVFRLPSAQGTTGTELYTWSATSLSNLFRAAGFVSNLSDVSESEGFLVITVEKP